MNCTIRVSCVCVTWLSLCLLSTSVGFGADNDVKSGNDKPLIKTTHVHKTVGDVKVEADVYRPEGAEARPVVVWIHGAGFGGAAKVPLDADKYLLNRRRNHDTHNS